MTSEQLKTLEANLWKAADDLRANSKLTATEYSFPVLGLIFLRHAYNRYKNAKEQIEKNLPVHPQRGRRAITKDDFLNARALYLPEHALSGRILPIFLKVKILGNTSTKQ